MKTNLIIEQIIRKFLKEQTETDRQRFDRINNTNKTELTDTDRIWADDYAKKNNLEFSGGIVTSREVNITSNTTDYVGAKSRTITNLDTFKDAINAVRLTNASVKPEDVRGFSVQINFYRPGKTETIPTEQRLLEKVATIVSNDSKVGKQSKYAKGDYVYIVSNDMKGRPGKALFNVWVLDSQWMQTHNMESILKLITRKVTIGSSNMVEWSSMLGAIRSTSGSDSFFNSQEINAFNQINDSNNARAAQEKLAQANAEIINAKIQQQKEPLPVVDKDGDKSTTQDEKDKSTTQDEKDKLITYPYALPDNSTVITTSTNDPYVYTKVGKIWKSKSKAQFEATVKTSEYKPDFDLTVKTGPATDKLNAQLISSKYTLGSVLNLGELGTKIDVYVLKNNKIIPYKENDKPIKYTVNPKYPVTFNDIYKTYSKVTIENKPFYILNNSIQ